MLSKEFETWVELGNISCFDEFSFWTSFPQLDGLKAQGKSF
jgi:hypothetical protein